jgi:hypothetical protein
MCLPRFDVVVVVEVEVEAVDPVEEPDAVNPLLLDPVGVAVVIVKVEKCSASPTRSSSSRGVL